MNEKHLSNELTPTGNLLYLEISTFSRKFYKFYNPLLSLSVHYNSMCPLSGHNIHLENESNILAFLKDMTQLQWTKKIEGSDKNLSSSSTASRHFPNVSEWMVHWYSKAHT